MKDVISALSAHVTAHGAVKTANLIGHSNTSTLSRWIKSGKMPEYLVKGIRAILEADGCLKPLSKGGKQ